MTDTEHAAATKRRLADERQARDKASKESAKAAADIKPTPTQEENDLAASGVPLTEHEPDGSGPDPNVPASKAMEAAKPKGGGYQTKTA